MAKIVRREIRKRGSLPQVRHDGVAAIDRPVIDDATDRRKIDQAPMPLYDRAGHFLFRSVADRQRSRVYEIGLPSEAIGEVVL